MVTIQTDDQFVLQQDSQSEGNHEDGSGVSTEFEMSEGGRRSGVGVVVQREFVNTVLAKSEAAPLSSETLLIHRRSPSRREGK